MRFLPYAAALLLGTGCIGTANMTHEQTAALELERQQRAMQVLNVPEAELRRLSGDYITSRLVASELGNEAARYAGQTGISYDKAIFDLFNRIDTGDHIITPEEVRAYRASEGRKK